MPRTFPYIIGPAEGHAHQRVKSAESYLAAQARYLAMNRDAGDDAVPHAATAEELARASEPFIAVGQWKLRCACNNEPSVSVAWDLACCFECGAIFRNLPFPDDRVAIERVLVMRKRQHRNWSSQESLADVIAQNIAHGDEVPDGL